jgi:hypothetical protein
MRELKRKDLIHFQKDKNENYPQILSGDANTLQHVQWLHTLQGHRGILESGRKSDGSNLKFKMVTIMQSICWTSRKQCKMFTRIVSTTTNTAKEKV